MISQLSFLHVLSLYESIRDESNKYLVSKNTIRKKRSTYFTSQNWNRLHLLTKHYTHTAMLLTAAD